MYCSGEILSSFGLALGMVSSTSPNITDVLAWGSGRRVMKSFNSYSLLGSLAWAHSKGSKVWCGLPLLWSSRDEAGCPSSCSKVVASSPRARASSRPWLLAVWRPSWLLCWSPPVEEGLGSFVVPPGGCAGTPDSAAFPGLPVAGGDGSIVGGFRSSTAFWSRSSWPSDRALAKCFWMRDVFKSCMDVIEQNPLSVNSFKVSSDNSRSWHHFVKSSMMTERALAAGLMWHSSQPAGHWHRYGGAVWSTLSPSHVTPGQWGQDQIYWVTLWNSLQRVPYRVAN